MISVNSVVFKFSFVYVLFSFNCRLCLAVCVAWVWDTRLLGWWWVCDSGYFYVFDAVCVFVVWILLLDFCVGAVRFSARFAVGLRCLCLRMSISCFLWSL